MQSRHTAVSLVIVIRAHCYKTFLKHFATENENGHVLLGVSVSFRFVPNEQDNGLLEPSACNQ